MFCIFFTKIEKNSNFYIKYNDASVLYLIFLKNLKSEGIIIF